MLANTGTYIDAPFHRFEDGNDIAAYPLEAVADLPGGVIRATERDGRALDAPRFRGRAPRREAVAFPTRLGAALRTGPEAPGPSLPDRPPGAVLRGSAGP